MKSFVWIVTLCMLVTLVNAPVLAEDKPAADASAAASPAPEAKKYSCEHCKVTKDAPGKCDCGAELKEVTEPATEKKEEKKDEAKPAETK